MARKRSECIDKESKSAMEQIKKIREALEDASSYIELLSDSDHEEERDEAAFSLHKNFKALTALDELEKELKEQEDIGDFISEALDELI